MCTVNTDETREVPTVKKVEHRGPAPWRSGNVEEPHMYSRGPRTNNDQTKVKTHIFRGNRGLMITLIDIVVVTILFIVFYTLLLPLSGGVTIQPYRLEIEHIVAEETVEISVLIRHRPPGLFSMPAEQSPPGQPIVTLRAGNASIADLAPREGEHRYMVLAVPLSSIPDAARETGTVELILQIRDEVRRYRIDLR